MYETEDFVYVIILGLKKRDRRLKGLKYFLRYYNELFKSFKTKHGFQLKNGIKKFYNKIIQF